MKFFEDIIRRRFRNARSVEGVEPDELWQSIEAELPPAEIGEERKRRRYWWLLLLVIPIGFFWWQRPVASNANHDQAAVETLEQTEEQSSAPSITLSTPTDVPSTEEAKERLSSKQQNSEDATTATIAPDVEQTSQNTEEITPSTNTQSIAHQTPSDIHRQPTANVPEQASIDTNKKQITLSNVPTAERDEQLTSKAMEVDAETITAPSESIEIPKPRASTLFEDPLAGLTTETLAPLGHDDQTPDVTRPILLPIEQNRRGHMSVGVFFGTHLWLDQFEATSQGETLQAAHQSEVGYSSALEIQWRLSPEIYLNTGFEYVISQTRFDLITSWDTMTYRDGPGSDLVNAIATRRVRHYNKHVFYSIPVTIGYEKQAGRFGFGLNAGVRFNVITSQKGRSLDAAEQIVSYPDNESEVLPYRRFFLAYQLQPYVAYQLNPGLRLQVRPDVRYQQHGHSDLYDLKHHSWQLGLSAGIFYSIK